MTSRAGNAAAENASGEQAAPGRVQKLLASLLDLFQTRVDLLGTELREELLRFGVLLVGACAVLLAMTLGLGLLTAALVLALWQDHPLLGLSVAGVFFMALGALTSWTMSRTLRAKTRPFEATLSQLQRDRDAMRIRP